MLLILMLIAGLLTACGPSASEIRQQQYRAWYQTLTPEQQEREDQREHERNLAAMEALSRMQMNRPLFSLPPAPSYQVPTYGTTQQLQQTNCRSRMVGRTLYTDCY